MLKILTQWSEKKREKKKNNIPKGDQPEEKKVWMNCATYLDMERKEWHLFMIQ